MSTLYTGIVADDMDRIRHRYGADVVCTPLIEVVAVADDMLLRQAVASVATYDYLLFTSRFAVEAFMGYLDGPQRSALPVTVVSIGPSTTAALVRHGLKQVIQTEEDHSYGVVDWFSGQSRGRVLIPRSSKALSLIPDGLRLLGFEVDVVTAYENRMPENPSRVDLDAIERIVFTSPSTIDHFIRLYVALPRGKTFVTRGPVTKQHLQTIINTQMI